MLPQFHFLLAQFTGLGEVLIADGILLSFWTERSSCPLPWPRGQLRIEQTHAGTGFIDQIDGLVGQEAIRDVAISEGCSCHKGVVGDLEAVVLLVTLAQATQDFDGVVDGRLANIHRLETALQGGIPFDVLAVLIEGGGTDALQLTAGEGRLEDVGGIDAPSAAPAPIRVCTSSITRITFPAALISSMIFLRRSSNSPRVLGAGHQQTDI